jgi:hypothetical protein
MRGPTSLDERRSMVCFTEIKDRHEESSQEDRVEKGIPTETDGSKK